MWIKGLDDIDNRILNLLLNNGRMSYSEIGEIVGLSRTSVKNRIAELEDQGIISGYWRARNCLKPRSLNSDDLKIKKQDGFCPVFFLFVLYYFVSQ